MKETYNYWAIIVSAILNLAIGFVWFMLLFKVPYIEGLGRTQEQMDMGPSGLVASIYQLIGNVVMGFVLAWLIKKLGCTMVSQSLSLGVLLWLGFVAAVLGPMYAFQAFPLSFFLITSVVILIYIGVAATLLTVWK